MSENKYSLICSTFTGTLNQLHFILFFHLSSHFIFQFLHVVLWSTLACLLDPYVINGSQLTNSSSVTDLGLLVDSHLTFNHHISNILTNATQSVGVFFHGFSSHHIALIKKAFITYIRSSLEFNSNI